ncbi:metallophosphoesterase (plasmid) [Ensifer adhaerens]|uniref:metallophosphoesterase n=1 Tax=Ensifer adhaerens TaxID=106592 RepID=UPI0023A92048|nr:metallophosphoesterase [Ensifer adhaerens]WDZ80816.1 metallophosphoesterase [Ensifer adhaerens]
MSKLSRIPFGLDDPKLLSIEFGLSFGVHGYLFDNDAEGPIWAVHSVGIDPRSATHLGWSWDEDGAAKRGSHASVGSAVENQGSPPDTTGNTAASSNDAPADTLRSSNAATLNSAAASTLAVGPIFEARVSTAADDIEEKSSGSISANINDLDMGYDGTTRQTVGLRFTGIDVPRGAVITNAYIQFTSDEISSGLASFLIRGEDADESAAFTAIKFNVSSRPTTDASVTWDVASWTVRGEAGAAERTPDLKAIVQEIIDRGGWAALNDMAFMLTGTGTRTAKSYEGSAAGAPLLHIEYYVPVAGSPVAFNTQADADPANNQIAELAAAGTAVGITASASDPDAGSTVTYSVNDQRFAIDSNGVITRSGTGTLDFETQTSITLTVTATSSDQSTATQTYTVSILNSQEPIAFKTPADADAATNQIAELAAAGTAVGITASAGDPDAGSTVTYSLSDNRFAIDANGVVTRSGTGTLNAQAEPSITLTVTATSSDGSTATQAFTLGVLGSQQPVAFNAPADADATTNQITELAAAGTAVGITASARDPNPGDTITYSIDDPRFTIDTNGAIKRSNVGTLDFETQTSILLTVTATSSDQSTATQSYTLNILNSPEPVAFKTPADADPTTNQIVELAAAGTKVGITASAGDPDAGSTVTYSLNDTRFAIDSNGVITRSGVGALDFETQTSITLTVTATSSDQTTATQAYTLSILNSQEPVSFRTPADADTAADRIAQNAAAGTRVGITASASDPDAGSTVTYSLTDTRFAIDANGVITRSATGTLNAQTEPSITLHVTATSSDGSTATHDYALNVAAQTGPQTLYRFAIFGDYGDTNLNGEKAVAALIHSWNVDFALTVGDNVYAPQTMDAAIGQQYHDYIGNYQGAYGAGSAINRFFPVLGNHEYDDGNLTNYLNYFTLPDNERYYDFQIGPVHFFALNSNKQDPDGRSSTSVQGQWMHATLDASNASFNVAYFHHTPYNPSGSTTTMQWPFEPWGVNAVFAGHQHNYYRENRDDNGDGVQLPYTTTGLGGSGRDVPNVGTSLVTVTDQGMLIEFYKVTSFNGTTVTSSLTDSYFISTPVGRAPTIANGAYVLNGTTGADYLWGLGSNATLTGGRGNDTLVGGKNSNLFVFHTGDGNDTILNFRAGASTGDVLDLRDYGIDSASKFQQVATNQGANVVANLSGTDHLTLVGLHADQLHDDNFVRTGLLV